MNLNKKSIKDLFSFPWFKNRDFSEISPKFLKKTFSTTGIVILVAFLFMCFEIYIPANPFSRETITYEVKKGLGDEDIAAELEKLGAIRNSDFFRFYVVASFRHSSLQAGKYNFSPRMSIYTIVQKMSSGDVVRNKITVLEGWDARDIAKYFEEKNVCQKGEFLSLIKKDYSADYDFLRDKPQNIDLEGYLFPDTYETAEGDSCKDVLGVMLANFGKKMTPDLRAEIKKQNKSIFDIVTMASMIEKEVRNISDKKTVSGILWKRISIGMPLQIDATINYITGKSDPGVAIKDTKIDSPYNTYKYYGLPKGPISNPGANSILAAIYPTPTDYLFYLSDGKTYFSKTLQEHNIAKAKYLE